MTDVAVADLAAMDRGALVALWSDLFGTPVPKSFSQQMMRRFIAYDLQVRRSGDLPSEVVAKITRAGTTPARPQSPRLKPGGRLLREWNGRTHVVEVVDGGFLWNGTRHASLSAIARAITGARWSGPRFFGLTAKEAGRS
jgi:hypothetical protein